MRTARSGKLVESLESRQLLAINLQLDYSLDTNHFFDDTARRDLLQLAVNSFEARLGDTLNAITPGGVNSWTIELLDPATGSQKSIPGPTIPADTVLLYVGGRVLGGSELGNGGPAGYGASGTQSFFDSIDGRGESGALATPATDYAPFAGSISFDTSANWFFGASNSGQTSQQSDFYSVALHELGHVLGIGTADSWATKSSGGNFIGAASEASFGGPVPLSPEGAHWKEGTKSNNKEAAMDPSLLTGTRKIFTDLDWAGLDDIGWDILPAATGAISGKVFNDVNANNDIDAGEVGISGWTVYLDTNNNNIKDAGETSTVTDASGNYSFSGLSDGTYHLKQVFQSGWRKTLPLKGTQGYDVTISGAAVSGKLFGMTHNILLAGIAFNDVNKNGTRDAGEALMSGVTISIISNGSTITTRVTNADGSWQVNGLAAGTGQAKVTAVPAGYTVQSPAGGLYSGSMTAGEANANLNFGLVKTAPAPLLAPAAGEILTNSFDGLDFFAA